jgi:parallel beta-helix repeat protein
MHSASGRARPPRWWKHEIGKPIDPWRAVMKRLRLIFGALIGALILLAFLPAPEDAPIPPAQQGGGARQAPWSVSGLQAPFPDLPPVDPAAAALGRLLFYDPILSANRDRSCATCHHPDLGFADGLPLAQAAHGGELRRNTPSLWNVAFVPHLFWDGRADSLERQMLAPLTNPDELGANIDVLLDRLRAIEEYRQLFARAYGDDAITLERVTDAVAAFQRTLISRNSPFDRFAAGDRDALTPAQRRGFDVFRSAQTRCMECHALPLFTHHTFHILGVPDYSINNPDRGRAEIVSAPASERAFRTPSLRNVALTAPYMHNGAFATLEEVIEFYAIGGGSAFRTGALADEKVRGFHLTDQQISDLVAFLHALTDEPAELIAIPERVPSGLPVVEPRVNPARGAVERINAPPRRSAQPRAPMTLLVTPNETIQSAVDRALPGDTVLILPGVYHETVYVDQPNITIRGVIEGGERPWLDGRGVLSDGFNTTGNHFTLENIGIRNYIGNGVITTGARGVVYRDLVIVNTGLYGVYPVEVTDVLIERLTVTGIRDAAIYVGQSRPPIIVRDNTAFGNVTGIEIENSVGAEVYNNHVYNNTGGILVFLLPNNPSRVACCTRVYNNRIESNNHPNFGDPNSIVGLVPPGTGMLILSADSTEVFGNTFRDNMTGGIGVTSLYMLFGRGTVFDLGALPEYNWIHDNFY